MFYNQYTGENNMTVNSPNIIILLLMIFIFGTVCADQTAHDRKDNGESPMTDKQLEGNIHAPEFPAGMEWLNTDRPLTLEEFRGKLVLLDFWTFCCINCMHILPDLKKLEDKYPEELVVIGVHSAKFTNEKDSEAIRQAILRYEIRHPVVNDHNFEIWSQYGARAWPTLVLINPNGKIIGSHSGEGIFEPFDNILSHAIEYFDAKGELHRAPLDLTPEKKNVNTLLSFPGKIKADPKTGRLIITDSNNNRLLVTDSTGKIEFVIGGGTQGRRDGDFSTAQFNRPQGIFPDGDLIYIADTENHLIRIADLQKGEVKTILGTGTQARSYNIAGSGTDVALNSPWDVLVHDDMLYIAMAGPHQLWSVDLSTLYAQPHAGSGRETRIDGPLLDAALAQPSGLTTDGKKLYFADSETSSIRSADIDPAGNVETIIGVDLFEYGDIDGGIETARLQHPLGVVHSDGLLYIADTYNSKIKIIDPVEKNVTTLAGTGYAGYMDGVPDEAQFNEPSGITILGNKLYVADGNNHAIRIIDLDKKSVSTLEVTGLDKLALRNTDRFTGRTIKTDPVKIIRGNNVLRYAVNLPDGYKFTERAPFYINRSTADENVIEFVGEENTFDALRPEFPVDIPFTAQKGSTEIMIDAVVYFCENGSGICLFDNVRLIVPVEITDDGNNYLDLSVDVSISPI